MTESSKPQIRCTSCDELVSIDASTCPHCGQSFITRGLALGLIVLGYPVLVPGSAVLTALVVPDIIFSDVGGWSGVGTSAVVVYVLASAVTWSTYTDRREKIENASETGAD